MSAGAIIIVAIAASGVLMMRFRKQWLAKINIAVTNRITGLFAGWMPGFGILTHVGRKSGKVYRTPINVFRASNGFIIALTYSSQSEWVKNVLAAGGCELKTRGKKYQLYAGPKVVRDPTRRRFPIPVRGVLRIVGADEYIELSTSQFSAEGQASAHCRVAKYSTDNSARTSDHSRGPRAADMQRAALRVKLVRS